MKPFSDGGAEPLRDACAISFPVAFEYEASGTPVVIPVATGDDVCIIIVVGAFDVLSDIATDTLVLASAIGASGIGVWAFASGIADWPSIGASGTEVVPNSILDGIEGTIGGIEAVLTPIGMAVFTSGGWVDESAATGGIGWTDAGWIGWIGWAPWAIGAIDTAGTTGAADDPPSWMITVFCSFGFNALYNVSPPIPVSKAVCKPDPPPLDPDCGCW